MFQIAFNNCCAPHLDLPHATWRCAVPRLNDAVLLSKPLVAVLPDDSQLLSDSSDTRGSMVSHEMD